MIYIGSHLSSSKGLLSMGKHAKELGADTFAFFTRNPRGGKAKELDEQDAQNLVEFLKENHFGKIVAHAPYTLNLCSDKDDIRIFAKNILTDDLKRMEYTPNNYYNFHPGSHVGQRVDAAMHYIADSLNEAMVAQQKMTTTVLFETMAGKGTEVGRNFEEIAKLIEMTEDKSHIGVCLDTCHIWDGGYDIRDVNSVLDEFDKVIGINRLKAVHFNDSMNSLGSHKDRHAKIGEGQITEAALKQIVTCPRLQNLPFILETPNDDAGYAKEIAIIRSWMI